MRRLVILGAMVALLLSLIATPASAAPPSNDDRGSATTIGALPYSDAVNTTEATEQGSDPDCGTETVWYSFTPAADGRYRAETVGSDYDTMLAVGAVTSGGLDLIACNDDFDDLTSAVSWYAKAGQEYLIMAGTCCGGEDGTGGNLEFSLRRVPRKIHVDVSIAPTGHVNRKGGAVIHGFLECQRGAGASGEIDGKGRQAAGRFWITGFGSTGLRCNRGFRLRLRGDIGRFAAGPMQVRVTAEAFKDGSGDTDTERRMVRLRQAD